MIYSLLFTAPDVHGVPSFLREARNLQRHEAPTGAPSSGPARTTKPTSAGLTKSTIDVAPMPENTCPRDQASRDVLQQALDSRLRPHPDVHGHDCQHPRRPLPRAAPRGPHRQHARRDGLLRARHRAHSRQRRCHGHGLHLYGRCRWRRHPRPGGARSRAARDRPGCRQHRGAVAAHVVDAALRRARRAGRLGDLGGRHRAVGHEGASAPGSRSTRRWAASIHACRAMPAASTSGCRSRPCLPRPTPISSAASGRSR